MISRILGALAATALTLTATAQTPSAEKQRMIDLGVEFKTARALYDHFKQEANGGKPLDWRSVERLSEQLTGRPNLAGDRKTVVYATPIVALPEGSAPDLKNKSFKQIQSWKRSETPRLCVTGPTL